MAILKLQIGREAGIHGTVNAVELSEGKFGPQYRFTLDGGDDVYLGKDQVERQATYNKLDAPSDFIGREVFLWKKPMANDPTKSFLNIEFGKAPASNGVASAAREDDYAGRQMRNLVAAPKKSYDDIKDTYVATLGDAVSIADDFAAFNDGVRLSETGMLSVAATLFIARSREGV